MGNTPSVGKTTPRLPRQPRPRNQNPIFSGVLGETVGPLVQHTEALSLTVTPLLGNAPVVLMSPEEISALGPERPKRLENLKRIWFGELHVEIQWSDEAQEWADEKQFRIAVNGFKSKETLAAIAKVLETQLARFSIDFNQLRIRAIDGKDRAKVTFNVIDLRGGADFQAINALEHTVHLLTNLHDLGLDDFLASVCEVPEVHSALSEPGWICKTVLPPGFRGLLACIEALVRAGHCEAAYQLFCDLLSPYKRMQESIFCLDDSEHSLLPLLGQPEVQRIEAFTYGLCCSDLLEIEDDARRYRYAIQTGKIVLRELLLTQNNTDDIPERHLRVFKVISSLCDDPEAAICELLDLRKSLRAAVLQNPKARQLLRIVDPHPLKVFDDIDRNAHQVFFDRLQRLRDRGFTFPGPDDPFGAAPIEFVDDAPVGRPTIERLFELAEAAVMCRGLTSWATGVLLFLSQFVPHDDHLKRARALRDRIQMAVKFDPTYPAVAKVTDDAIAELES